jgi:hypothetical protein
MKERKFEINPKINSKLDLIGIYGFLKFLMKRYFTNPLSILVLIIPMILISVLPVTMPAMLIYTGALSIGLISQLFLTYGSAVMSIRKSNFYSTLITTRFNRKVLYTAAVIFIFIIAFLFAFLMVGLMSLLNLIPNFYHPGFTRFDTMNYQQGALSFIDGN